MFLKISNSCYRDGSLRLEFFHEGVLASWGQTVRWLHRWNRWCPWGCTWDPSVGLDPVWACKASGRPCVMCSWWLSGGGGLLRSFMVALGGIVIVVPLWWKGRNFDTSSECRNKRFIPPWGLKTVLYLANFASSRSSSQSSWDPRARTVLRALKWAVFSKSEIIAPAVFFRSCHFFLI